MLSVEVTEIEVLRKQLAINHTDREIVMDFFSVRD